MKNLWKGARRCPPEEMIEVGIVNRPVSIRMVSSVMDLRTPLMIGKAKDLKVVKARVGKLPCGNGNRNNSYLPKSGLEVWL